MLTLERLCQRTSRDNVVTGSTYRHRGERDSGRPVELPSVGSEALSALRMGTLMLCPALLVIGIGGAVLSALGDCAVGAELLPALWRHLRWYVGWTLGLFSPVIAVGLAMEVGRLACARRWVGATPHLLRSGALRNQRASRLFVPRLFAGSVVPEDGQRKVKTHLTGDELFEGS